MFTCEELATVNKTDNISDIILIVKDGPYTKTNIQTNKQQKNSGYVISEVVISTMEQIEDRGNQKRREDACCADGWRRNIMVTVNGAMS